MHINRKVNNLLAKFGNDVLQDLIVESMRLTYLKSFHIGELLVQIARFPKNVMLTIDGILDAFCEFFDKNLYNSGTMNIQRNWNYIMRNVSYQALHRQWIRNFHDTLTEVVSKLVDHNVGSQGQHEVNQAV